METEAETAALQPHTKEHSATGSWKGRKALEGVWPQGHLDFGLPASRTDREPIAAVLGHPVCSRLSQRPRDTRAVGGFDFNHTQIFKVTF